MKVNDKALFEGISKSINNDGIIKVTTQGWKKFVICTNKRRPYITEANLHADHNYKINELLFLMGIVPGKILLYDNVTHAGIDFIVEYEEHVTAPGIEKVIEKVDLTMSEILQTAEGKYAEIVDIEEVFNNSTSALDCESGIILYRNGLCLDMSDFEKLSVGE